MLFYVNSDGHLRQKSRTISGRKPSVVHGGASTTHIKNRGHRIIDKIKGNIESLRRISHLLGELCSYSGVSRIIIQDLQSLVTQLSIEQLPRPFFPGKSNLFPSKAAASLCTPFVSLHPSCHHDPGLLEALSSVLLKNIISTPSVLHLAL